METPRRSPRPMDGDLDAALQQARVGDETGFSVIYATLAPAVLRFLGARDAWDPEQLTNEVFLSAFRGLADFSGDADRFRGWVFTIARNKAIDDARLRQRRPVVQDSSIPDAHAESADAAVFERLGREWVDEQLGLLTFDQREVLALRMLSDLSLQQIAEVVDKPVEAVKSLQRRGLARLAKENL